MIKTSNAGTLTADPTYKKENKVTGNKNKENGKRSSCIVLVISLITYVACMVYPKFSLEQQIRRFAFGKAWQYIASLGKKIARTAEYITSTLRLHYMA